MHLLDHFLSVPTFRGKRPLVLLGLKADASTPSPQTLLWAALVYELAPAGIRTGIYSTDDISGFRSVIAPTPDRGAVAAIVADVLLRRGAQVLMLTTAQHAALSEQLVTSVPARWATTQRPVANTLLLRPTYEATLHTLGKATRFNMRYYRRRLLRRMPLRLVPEAGGLFTPAQILSLNAASLNPFSPQLAVMQYEACSTLDGGFVVGLQSEEGQWLSLVGGWRQADYDRSALADEPLRLRARLPRHGDALLLRAA